MSWAVLFVTILAQSCKVMSHWAFPHLASFIRLGLRTNWVVFSVILLAQCGEFLSLRVFPPLSSLQQTGLADEPRFSHKVMRLYQTESSFSSRAAPPYSVFSMGHDQGSFVRCVAVSRSLCFCSAVCVYTINHAPSIVFASLASRESTSALIDNNS